MTHYELGPDDRCADGRWVVPFPQLRRQRVGSPVHLVLDGEPRVGRVVGHDIQRYPIVVLGGAA